MRPLIVRAATAAGVLLAASTASAQLSAVNPVSLGISAGAAVPTGDAGNFFNTGYSVDGILALHLPALPISFRGEVGYTRFGVKGDPGDFRFISGVANAVYTFSAGPVSIVRPYLIGGVGLYNGKNTDGGESRTKVGLNGGVGLEIPLSGITGFGEVRYTSVRSRNNADGTPNINYLPIRFGIRF